MARWAAHRAIRGVVDGAAKRLATKTGAPVSTVAAGVVVGARGDAAAHAPAGAAGESEAGRHRRLAARHARAQR